MRWSALAAVWNTLELLPVGVHRSKICASKFHMWAFLFVYGLLQCKAEGLITWSMCYVLA
jgi:hypothetical protein